MRTVIKCHSLPSEISFTGWRHFADGREISFRSRNCDEISPFVSAKYRSKRREISLELSSELSTKVRENKERNSRNSLRLLLHNTVILRFIAYMASCYVIYAKLIQLLVIQVTSSQSICSLKGYF